MKTDSNRSNKIIILGSSSFAREVAWLISEINQQRPNTWKLIGFWDGEEVSPGRSINTIPVIGLNVIKTLSSDFSAVAAIGNPSIRRRAVTQALELGCSSATLIHPSVHFDPETTTIDKGSIVCAGSVISVGVSIGSHVVVNWNCTIGHDSTLDDFVTLSPGCHLSGFSDIHRGSYIGAGAVIIEKHSIGENSVIGAGAVVTTDIPANVTAVGIPARTIK